MIEWRVMQTCRCECGMTYKVPDKYAGRRVRCVQPTLRSLGGKAKKGADFNDVVQRLARRRLG